MHQIWNVVHIGEQVRKIARERGFTTARLAREVNTSRQNMQSIYKRTGIDTEMLLKISKALNYDFFRWLSLSLEMDGVEEPAFNYRKLEHWEKLEQERDMLKKMTELYAFRLEKLEEELRALKK